MPRAASTKLKFGQPPPMLESDISKQVVGFMEIRGWRSLRTEWQYTPGARSTGEPGMADYLFIRFSDSPEVPGAGLALWLEFKRPSDRRKCRCLEIRGTRKRCGVCDQKHWQERERKRGALVWIVSDLDWFEELYQRTFGWLHVGVHAHGQLSLS